MMIDGMAMFIIPIDSPILISIATATTLRSGQDLKELRLRFNCVDRKVDLSDKFPGSAKIAKN